MTNLRKSNSNNKFSEDNSASEVSKDEGKSEKTTNGPIPLKHIFRKNGLGYKLIVRNSKVALFGLSSDRHWEISRIYITPANDRFGMHFPEAETISDNDRFGLDGSRTFQDEKRAMEYFKSFSLKLGEKNNDQYFQLENTDNGGSIQTKTYLTTIAGEIVPPTKKLSTSSTNIDDVVKINEAFSKGGLKYELIQRNKYVSLYEISSYAKLVGFEVSRIEILPAFTNPAGKQFPSREALTKDDIFGTDGSRSFFPGESERAQMYFENLTKEILSLENGSSEHFYTNG
jgi:hypothetical protein